MYFIIGNAHPALPPSYPPMDWVVPIPFCSFFMLYVGTTPRLVSGVSSTGAILSHYFLYLVPMQIQIFKFEKFDHFSNLKKLIASHEGENYAANISILVRHYKSQFRLGVLRQYPKITICVTC